MPVFGVSVSKCPNAQKIEKVGREGALVLGLLYHHPLLYLPACGVCRHGDGTEGTVACTFLPCCGRHCKLCGSIRLGARRPRSCAVAALPSTVPLVRAAVAAATRPRMTEAGDEEGERVAPGRAATAKFATDIH